VELFSKEKEHNLYNRRKENKALVGEYFHFRGSVVEKHGVLKVENMLVVYVEMIDHVTTGSEHDTL
jgi:hypothetical protein